MISETIQKELNKQIQREEHSSRLYLAMACWCEDRGYQGAAEFLYDHSDEERMHQLKMIHFLNDRGGSTQLMEMENIDLKFDSLLELFEEVLKHEQYISKSINEIYDVCLKEKDYTTGNFLHWYIEEQIEEESLVNTVLDKMRLAGNEKAGLFHIDKELASLAAAEAEEEGE